MKISFLCALGATCLMIGAAQADLKWTETLSMGGEGGDAGDFSVETTHYMNAEASRTDTKTKLGPVDLLSRQIDLCPTKKTLTLLDDPKLYSEEPLQMGSIMPTMPQMPTMGAVAMGGGDNGPKQSGTQTISYKLRDLGTEKILDVDTHHYALDTSTTSTGCAGNDTSKTSIEVWKANIPLPAPCLATTFEGTVKNMGHFTSSCDVKTTFVGDTKVAGDVFSGLLMRLKVGQGQDAFTREVTMLSRAKLEDNVFQVPTDYRKVTPDELAKARQAAMMKAVMGGANGDGDTPDTPAAPDAGNN